MKSPANEYLEFCKASNKPCPRFMKMKLAEQRLKLVVDNMSTACVFITKGSTRLEFNQAGVSLFGLSGSIVDKEKWFAEFSPKFQPDGCLSAERMSEITKQAYKEGNIHFEWAHKNVAGEVFPAEITLVSVEWHDSPSLVVFIKDKREFYKAQEAERMVRQRLKAMLDSSPLACTVVDENFKVLEVNQEITNLLGIPDKQVYLDRPMDLSPKLQPDGQPSHEKMIEKLKYAFEVGRDHFEWMHNTLDGTLVPTEVTLVRVQLEGQNLVLVYKRDLRELKNAIFLKEKLEKLAFFDALTGARSRHYFFTQAEEEMKNNLKESFHIIMVDVDLFKHVNDEHGHVVGDEVLKILVARMYKATRQNTLIARYGGEEFIIMLLRINNKNAEKVARRIKYQVESEKFQVGHLKISITVSVGLAARESQEESLSDLIINADKALYAAKRIGRNSVMIYSDVKN